MGNYKAKLAVYYNTKETKSIMPSSQLAQQCYPLQQGPGALQVVQLENSAQTVNDFTLLRIISKSSKGKFCQVRYKKNLKIYAMKITKKSKSVSTKTLESVQHPYIIKMRYAFQTSNKIYQIFDYFPGGELSLRISKENGFDLQQTQIYAAEVLLALEFLNSQNIEYNLNPKSILINEEGHLLLTNFGIEEKDQKMQATAEKPYYLAPEILNNAPCNQSLDI